jgi:DHA3 family macrolide efflux protein-like MFS transporter
MIAADSLVALMALCVAYLFWADAMRVWHVYVITLVRAVGGIFHWPAMQASTSLMVPKEHLSRVSGLNQTMYGVMNIVGPPLGAMLLAVLPLHGIMLIDVGTAVLAISPLLFVHIPQPEPLSSSSGGGRESGGKKPSVWSDVHEGLGYVLGWRGLFIILIMAMVVNFVLTPAGSLTPLLVTRYFKGEALQLGWLNSAWGVGVVLGGLLLSAWGGFHRRIYTTLIGLTVMGLGFMLLGLTPATAFWLAVAANFVVGFMNPITNGPLFAVLQATIAPEMQGRVFMLIGSLSSAMSPLSLAIAGPIADVVGVRVWYVVGGILCVLMGVGAFFVPAIVNLERGRKGHGLEA